MKNLVKKSMMAVAAALGLGWASTAYAAGGNVWSIMRCDENGTTIPVTAQTTVGVKEWIYFRVRMWNHIDIGTGKYYRWTRRLVKSSDSTVVSDETAIANAWATEKPKIGIFAAGMDTPVFAELVKINSTDYFSDFIFGYHVQAGDFALPVDIAVIDPDTGNPVPSYSGNGSTYYVDFDVNGGDYKWEFSGFDGANWFAGPDSELVWTGGEPTEVTLYGNDEQSKYGEKTATKGTGTAFIEHTGFSLETVHFGDPETMTTLDVCTVAESDDEAQAYLIADVTMDTPRTFYVWSDNEKALTMEGVNENVTKRVVDATTGEEAYVAAVTMVNDSASFGLYAKSRTEGDANLIISATPHYVLKKSGERLDNDKWSSYVKIGVTITEPKPTTLSVSVGNSGSESLYANGDRTPWQSTKVTVKLNVPAKDDLRIALNPSVTANGEAAENWKDFVFFSTSREYAGDAPPPADAVDATLDNVVIKKGQRSYELYVYALRSVAQNTTLTLAPQAIDDTEEFVKQTQPRSVAVYSSTTVNKEQLEGITAIINKPADLKVKVKDAYADEQAGLATGGYRLEVRLLAGDSYTLFTVDNLFLANRDPVDGYYTLYADPAENKLPQVTFTSENQTTSEIRVIPPVGVGDPAWQTFTHYVLDNAVAVTKVSGFGEDGAATEGEEFCIRVTTKKTPVSKLYCYLVNTDDDSVKSAMSSNDTGYDIVVCKDNEANPPTGYPVPMESLGDEVPKVYGAELKLTAVTAMLNVPFSVVFTTSDKWDPATAVADIPAGTFMLNVANASAEAAELWVYEDRTEGAKRLDRTTGGALEKSVLATRQRAFRVRINDTDYDKQNGMRVKWTVQKLVGSSRTDMPLNVDYSETDQFVYYFVSKSSPEVITADSPAAWFRYQFPSEGKYYVTAEVWDASDDPGENEDAQIDKPGSTITAIVTVADPPDMHEIFEDNIQERFTGLVDDESKGYYYLTEGASTPYVLDFTLPDPDPAYLGTPIKARVTLSPANPNETNPGWIELVPASGDPAPERDGNTTVYEHTYRSVTDPWKLRVNMQTLDGNVDEASAEYGTKGWTIKWEVIEGDTLPSKGMTAAEYWEEKMVFSADRPIKIINRAPVPSAVVYMSAEEDEEGRNVSSYTNMMAETKIPWSVSDVAADRTTPWTYAGQTVTGIRVQVTDCLNLDETYFFATEANNYSGNYSPQWINSQLEGHFRLAFYDKDGGFVTSELYIKPARPTKNVTSVANWPSGGNSNIPISYKYAMAAGAGYGRTFVADGTFQYADTFSLYWDCGTSASSAKVYAFGYRQGDVDNGRLALRDNNRYYDVWISPQGNHVRNATTSDSGYYRYSTSDDQLDSFFYGWITATEPGGAEYTFSASPEVTDEPPKWMELRLPTEKNGDKDATATYPNTYVEAVFSREYRTSDQLGDINADGIPDYYMVYPGWANGILAEPDGACGELKPINAYNEDDDYYPGDSHDGASALIPGAVSGWSSSSLPFDAFHEIRGYHAGLNFGMFKFNNAERATYGWVSNLELSEIEKEALLRRLFNRRDTINRKKFTNPQSLVETSNWSETEELRLIYNIIKTLYYKGIAPEAAHVSNEQERRFYVDDAYIAAHTTKSEIDRTVVNEDTGEEENSPTFAWLRTYTPTGAIDPVMVTNYVGLVAYTNEEKYAKGEADAITFANVTDLQSIDQVDIGNWLWPENIPASEYRAQQAAVKAYIDYEWHNFKPISNTGWGWTCENRTDPTIDDTDGDGMPDGYEYWIWYAAVVGSGKEPLTGCRFNIKDVEDYDNLISASEISSLYNPNISRNWLHTDTDNDGIYDLEEFLIGTSPVHWDTDRDGLSDTYEVMYNINPLSAAPGQNGGANSDGDYMAFWKATADDPLGAYEWVYVAADGTYWLLDTEYSRDFDGTGTKYKYISSNKQTITMPIEGEEPIHGIRVVPFNGGYTLPTEDTQKYTERGNTVVEFTVEDPFVFDTAKTLAANPNNAGLAQNQKKVRNETVSLYHHQVHNYFGFDPRTAWYKAANGSVSSTSRWVGSTVYTSGTAQNTTAFTAKDEFLLIKYRQIVGLRNADEDAKNLGDPESVSWVVGYNSAKVEDGDIYNNKPMLYAMLRDGTTNPSANYEARTWGDDPVEYAMDQHGADTDGDAVPDGWELYIGVDPNRDWRIAKGSPGYDTLYHDAGTVYKSPMDETESDNWRDGLTLAGEYAGTDSCGDYEACDTIYANHPLQSGSVIYRWQNKLMPTDPRNHDTDGDGINDGEEGSASWSEALTYGRWGQSDLLGEQGPVTVRHFGIYGDYEIGAGMWVSGGGMNPCSIDTDHDGLPDLWERQYAGVLFKGNKVATEDDGYDVFPLRTPPENLYDDLTAAAKAFGLSEEDGFTVIMGQDPTSQDAGTPTEKGQWSDYDWDGDGLQNWQEYMVQAMRHLRYDDSRTPLLGRDCAGFSQAEGKFVPGQWNGDKNFLRMSYVTPFSPGDDCEALESLGYPNFAKFVNENPDYLSILGYFADPPQPWDYARCDAGLKYMLPPRTLRDSVREEGTPSQVVTAEGPVWQYQGSTSTYTGAVQVVGTLVQAPKTRKNGTVGWFVVDPVMEVVKTAEPIVTISTGGKYVGTDPRLWDTDRDGMDDYYELYHGLNPLLGSIDDETSDIIARNGSAASIRRNAWIGWDNEAAPPCDPLKYPWMMGAADCDADGDGLNNAAESLSANLTSPNNYHTDPTPLWMTDTTVPDGDDFVLMKTTVVTNWAVSVTGEPVYMLGEDDEEIRVYRDITTNTVVAATIPMCKSPSYTKLYYQNDVGYNVLWRNSGKYIASFEENEGYDSDNDWRTDSGEVKNLSRKNSDPQDFSDPSRRQSIWFGGNSNKGAAISYVPTERNHWSGADLFKQFTVEAWIKPDNAASGQDQYIVCRASNYGEWDLYSWEETNAGSNAVVRLNFAIGINADGKLFAEYQDATEQTTRIVGDEVVNGKWIHVAATYDGKVIKLYRNGTVEMNASSTLIPANGVVTQLQNPQSISFFPVDTYRSVPSVTILGARPTGPGAFGVTAAAAAESWSDVADDFYAGRVAEVRTWDGARTQAEIVADHNVTYSVDDVKMKRLEFYADWRDGATRNDTVAESGSAKRLPAELIQYYNFVSLPGATDKNYLRLEPTGFVTNVLSVVRDPETAKPVSQSMLEVGWWSELAKSKVGTTAYTSKHVVPWIENMVTHLPRLSGVLDDSVFWSENYSGYTAAQFHDLSAYSFPNTLTMYNLQNRVSNEEAHLLNKFSRLGGISATAETVTNEVEEAVQYMWHRYDMRLGFDGITDLIPLGSAFAKRGEDYWDGEGAETAWQQTGVDSNANDLPDWWEELYGLGDDAKPDTLVQRKNVSMTAYEAYLRDLAAGMLPTKSINSAYANHEDADKNSLPDWWQDLYGVEGDAAADDDNDGLSNYTEYLLSEFFDLKVTFSPVKAKSISIYDSDYFFKIGQLYAGEIFTDHDFVEDVWEDKQGASYASRYAWDSRKDYDEDGWSNFAERRFSQFSASMFAPNISSTLAIEEVKDAPMPTLSLSLRYNGDQPPWEVSEDGGYSYSSTGNENQRNNVMAKVIVQTFTRDGIVVPDATYVLEPGALVQRNVLLGAWGSKTVRGTLAPGYIRTGTDEITLQVLAYSSVNNYYWSIYHETDDRIYSYYTYHRGTYKDFLIALYSYGSRLVTLLNDPTEWQDVALISSTQSADSQIGYLTHNGTQIGKINFQTGEYEIYFSKFSDMTTLNDTETVIDLSKSGFRLVYWSQLPTLQSNKMQLYLGEATTGYVKEGKNTIVAFLDRDNDGKYSSGEPLGMTYADIGWFKSSAEIEMTDTSPIITRANLLEGYSDRAAMWGVWDGDWTNLVEGVFSGGKYERVRVIRTLVDGFNIQKLGITDRVIFDKAINLDQRSYFYEGDVLENGAFDIDWDYFASDVLGKMDDPMEITYRIVLGNGPISGSSTNNLYPKATVRQFDTRSARTRPVVVEPGPESSVVYGSRPTFKWTMKMENPRVPGSWVDNNSYTAFKLQVRDGETVVYDSGMRLAPARDLSGVYHFVPDVYVGDLLDPEKDYTWRVSMYNAKFRTDAWSAGGNNTFRMNALTNNIGVVKVCAKYFGPANVLAKGEVRIEAFETPDFSGDPVARTYVRADMKSSVSTKDVEHTANAFLIGLNPGKYYVRGYIDMNTDDKGTYGTSRKKDAWESWGYVCERDGASADIFMPTTIEIDSLRGSGTVFDLYIEDADTNGNNLPDAWEMVQNGGALDNGSVKINDTLGCDVEINQKLTDNLQEKQNDVPTANLAAYVYNVIGNAGVAALILDADTDTHRSYGIAAASALAGSSAVSEATNVEIENFSVTNNVVTMKISGAGSTSNAVSPRLLGASATADTSGIYSLKGAGAGEQLEAVIEYVTDLSNLDWKPVPGAPRVRITLDGEGKFETESFEFTKPEGAEANCFFRFRIDN